VKPRIIAVVFIMTVALAVPYMAIGEVTVRVTNLEEKVISATYAWAAGNVGATEGIYPDPDGFDFAAGPVNVLSVIERNSGKSLKWEIVAARDNPLAQCVKVGYGEPIPDDHPFEVEITVEARTDNITQDSLGRFVFSYTTGHSATFVLPEGHALIYSNYPVLIDEHSGLLTVRAPQAAMKELVFKTRVLD